MRMPDFIIIGAMKSATTTLQEQLSAQPGIFMSEPKEPNFFSDDDQFAKGIGWYGGLFAPAGDGDLLGEASTHYTKLPTHPQTIARLKEQVPSPRLIYVMRHPIDRLVSHYIHQWSMGLFNCDINEAVSRYVELTAYSRYAMQLQPYFEAFGRDAVLPVFFDHLVREPQAELERVCRFIGYQSTPVFAQEKKQSNVSSERIRRFPFYDLLVQSGFATWLRRTFVPRELRNAVKDRLTMKNRPVLSDQTKSDLEALFNKDLALLGGWLGQSIDCGNFKQITSTQSLEWVAADE